MGNTSETPETAPLWRGWFRENRREPWRCIVSGDDEKEVHNRMIDESPGGDLCLLQGHRDPNVKEERRR